MKKLFVSFLIVWSSILLLPAQHVGFQDVSVQTFLNPNPGIKTYSEILTRSDLITVQLLNNTSRSLKVRLRLEIDGNNGLKAIIPEHAMTGFPITLSPQKPLLIDQDRLNNMYLGLSENDILLEGISLKQLIMNKTIRDGYYRVCISVYDYDTQELLSAGEPMGCSNLLAVSSIEPAMITSPINEQEITQLTPQFLNITWNPVVAATSIKYTLRIAQIPEGMNPYDVMNNDMFDIFKAENLHTPTYYYSISDPQLSPNFKYALQVTSIDENDRINIANEGKSDIVVFDYLATEIHETDFHSLKGTHKYTPTTNNTGGSATALASTENCNPALPSNREDIFDIGKTDIIRMGNFRILVDTHQKMSDAYSGTGVIIPDGMFASPIYVTFENCKINTDYEVYSGTAKAGQKSEYLALECVDNFGQVLNLEDNSSAGLADFYDKVFDPQRALLTHDVTEGSAMMDEVSVKLPLAFGDNNAQKVIISSIALCPTGATANLLVGKKLEGNPSATDRYLIFGAEDVCLTPGDIAGGANEDTKMGLLRSVTFMPNQEYAIHLKKSNNNYSEGCYALYNKNGVNDINIEGYIAVKNENIIPLNENNQPVAGKSLAAKFIGHGADWDDMVSQLDFKGNSNLPEFKITNKFAWKGLEEYSFEISQAYIDLSLNRNPEAMAFPPNYENDGNAWQGVYIKNVVVTLPAFLGERDGNATITGHHLIIDDDGFTSRIEGDDIITGNDGGKLAGQDFSVDHFELDIEKNSLKLLAFNGLISLEMIQDMEYEATVVIDHNKSVYTLNASPTEKIDFPIWGAKLNVNEASEITIVVDNGAPKLEANLHGKLDLDEEIGDIEGISIKGIDFENLKISTKSPFIHGGDFTPDGDIGISLAGFGGQLEDAIKIETKNAEGASNQSLSTLKLRPKLKLGEDFITASSLLSINGKRNSRGNWGFENIGISDIYVTGNLPAVNFEGAADWFVNDAVYGDGFHGRFNADFLGKVGIMSDLWFGHNYSDNYTYWSVSGAAKFATIPIVGVFGINAFGGGVYYNMTPHNIEQYNNTNNSIAHLQPTYIPHKGGWGFSALTGIATIDGMILNGKFGLFANFDGSSLLDIRLTGDATLLEKNLSNDNMLRLKGEIVYDHSNEILTAELGYKVNFPKEPTFLSSDPGGRSLNDKRVDMHFAGFDDWKIHLGTPQAPLSLRIGFDLADFGRIDLGSTNSYFDFGTRLPSPGALPSRVSKALDDDFSFTPTARGASGVMTGTHYELNYSSGDYFTILRCGVGFGAEAHMGYDLAIRHMPGINCEGESSFGINNWYASGRAYLYGKFEMWGKILGKKFDILGTEFAAALSAELPNPTYFRGKVRGRVSLPIVGGYSVKAGFKVGNKCEMEFDQDEFKESVEVEDVLERMYFENPVDSFYWFKPESNIKIDMNAFPGETVSKSVELNNGDSYELSTRVKYEISFFGNDERIFDEEFLLGESKNSNSGENSKIKVWHEGYNQLIISLCDGKGLPILLSNTNYRLSVKATMQYKINDNDWGTLTRDNGSIVYSRKSIRFVTSKLFQTDIENILLGVPAVNEAFFHPSDYRFGKLQWAEEKALDYYLMKGENIKLRMRFTEMGENTQNSEPVTADLMPINRQGYYQGVEFEIPKLKQNTVYKAWLEIAMDNSTYFDLAYDYYFKTSNYPTLQKKLSDLQAQFTKISGGTVDVSCPPIEELHKTNENNTHYRILPNGNVIQSDFRENCIETPSDLHTRYKVVFNSKDEGFSRIEGGIPKLKFKASLTDDENKTHWQEYRDSVRLAAYLPSQQQNEECTQIIEESAPLVDFDTKYQLVEHYDRIKQDGRNSYSLFSYYWQPDELMHPWYDYAQSSNPYKMPKGYYRLSRYFCFQNYGKVHFNTELTYLRYNQFPTDIVASLALNIGDIPPSELKKDFDNAKGAKEPLIDETEHRRDQATQNIDPHMTRDLPDGLNTGGNTAIGSGLVIPTGQGVTRGVGVTGTSGVAGGISIPGGGRVTSGVRVPRDNLPSNPASDFGFRQ